MDGVGVGRARRRGTRRAPGRAPARSGRGRVRTSRRHTPHPNCGARHGGRRRARAGARAVHELGVVERASASSTSRYSAMNAPTAPQPGLPAAAPRWPATSSGSRPSCRARASTARTCAAKARVPTAASSSAGQEPASPRSSSRMRNSCSGAVSRPGSGVVGVGPRRTSARQKAWMVSTCGASVVRPHGAHDAIAQLGRRLPRSPRRPARAGAPRAARCARPRPRQQGGLARAGGAQHEHRTCRVRPPRSSHGVIPSHATDTSPIRTHSTGGSRATDNSRATRWGGCRPADPAPTSQPRRLPCDPWR
jgi:hypothetical protein